MEDLISKRYSISFYIFLIEEKVYFVCIWRIPEKWKPREVVRLAGVYTPFLKRMINCAEETRQRKRGDLVSCGKGARKCMVNKDELVQFVV